VNAAGKLAGKRLIDHAVALNPALSAERLRHNMNPEMSLPAGTGAGVTLMLTRFIHNIEALRRESGREFFSDLCLHEHGTQVGEGWLTVNPKHLKPRVKIICQDLKVSSLALHNVRS